MISPARTEALRSLLTGKKDIQCEKKEDQKLAERISYGTLQNERFLDYCISRYSSRPINRLKKRPLCILRLSAYQLLFLDRVPPSAVVNDAVSLCRRMSEDYASGYVNAVLRRIASNKDLLLAENTEPSIRYSHPDWLVSSLSREYGEEFTEHFLIKNQEIPKLRLQVNTRKISLKDYLQKMDASHFPVYNVNKTLSSLLTDSTRVDTLPGYHEGLFYVQDDAARMAVHIADIQGDPLVLDVCAAPGGKSMAAAIEGAGKIVACDINSSRLLRCRENFKRLDLSVRLIEANATEYNPDWEKKFDLVLADVPCSGTGIIRKEPEIRKKDISILSDLIPLQKCILSNVSKYVKPGGILIYSTCSVLREENEEQLHTFLSENKSFSLSPLSAAGYLCESGMMRSWPQINGNDGFFAAKMIRQ